MKPAGFVRRLAIVLVCVLGPSAAIGQEVAARGSGPQGDEPKALAGAAYGVSTTDTLTINAAEFRPLVPSQEYQISFDLNLTAISGFTFYMAPVRLPSGALITNLELTGCDDDNLENHQLVVVLARVLDPNGVQETMATVASGPGCSSWSETSIANPAVDNPKYSYYVMVVFTSGIGPMYGPDLRFRAVRLYWNRQVTPLDGAADFSDVPLGNTYRQYVEAATASGILNECAVGRFCPDNPVTRAQLALALAKALGLKYP
jgi:hypothetical protein